METTAVVIEAPHRLRLRPFALPQPGVADVVVDIAWSGVSTGTEKLLWDGSMPPFPGLGYPLVPGYEAVGRVRAAGAKACHLEGRTVFVPGARCYGEVRGLFGGNASRVVVDAGRVVPLPDGTDARGVLLALAATAWHALAAPGAAAPDLIVGHGVLGRLLARLTLLRGAPAPTVWEQRVERRAGARGYQVIDPAEDPRRDYRAIYDVSGAAGLLDELIGRLSPQGEVVLAGFYAQPLSFAFPAAFTREARLRVAAEWQSTDLAAVAALLADRRLDLDGLINRRAPAADAPSAYATAFADPECLKLVLDWSDYA